MASKQDILIGVDLGTSATKVVAFDLAGNAVASATREYGVNTPHENWAEQDPEDWWKAAVGALRAITKKVSAGRVAGLSFSGQMHGSVFLDSRDRVIRPCLLWCDGRTGAECEEIIETVGKKAFLGATRNLPLTGFTLPKVMWLKNHEPENFEKLRTVLLPKDYLRFRLTGVKCMDEADGAGTVMMEVGRRRWAVGVLEKLGLDAAVLPPLTHSPDVVGRITAEAARATGLREGTLVVAGGGDQPVGAVGVGVFEEGQMMVSLGTSGVVFAPTAKAHTAGAGGMASFDHAVPGVSYLMGCINSAGGSLQWYRNTLGGEEVAQARREKRDAYDILMEGAAKAPVGAEGLLFLPYLMGERTPHNDPNARGVFFGLSPRHTKGHLTRAVIEGVTFALRDGLELVREKGVDVKEVRATGGGARSALWLKIMANVFGMPVRPVENPEGAAMGAALLAGVGTGAYKSFQEASKKAIRAGRPVKPTVGDVKKYEEVYSRYRRLYPALREEFVSH